MTTESSYTPVFKNLSRLVVYTSLALAVFFGLAVLVFVLRGKKEAPVAMPDLVGKYYVDVHNDLERLQLRVKIIKKSYADQGSGKVLFQSVPAGRPVLAREQLYLVVNQPEPVLTMPDFRRNSFEAAQTALKRITYEDRVYSLTQGAVTELYTDAFPDNTVVDQFPEPGSQVASGQKVYFLVARKKPGAAKLPPISIEALVGQNISVASDYLNKLGREYRISETKTTHEPSKIGQIYLAKESGKQTDTGNVSQVQLGLYTNADGTRFRDGLEIIEVELEDPGRCVAEVRHLSGEQSLLDTSLRRQVFVSQSHLPEEKVKIAFYRQGTSELRVLCGENQEVYRKIFEPDDLL